MSGEPSDSGSTHLNNLLLSQPLLESKPSVSSRTRSQVEVIDPLSAEIVSRYPSLSLEAGSSNSDGGEAERIDVSSNTDEGEKTINDLWLGGEQPFFSNDDVTEKNDNVGMPLVAKVERKPHVPAGFVPSCEDTDSSMNADRLARLKESCDPGCDLVVPTAGERCHRFGNFEPDQAIPNAVLSASFFKLGFSMPMHPFFVDMLNFYEIAPMQLSPNSFRVAACMYILYDQTFSVPLTPRELGYFYQLKGVGRKIGIFYLTSWNDRQGRCIKGNKRGMYDWMEMFLYCYDCEEVRKEWNLTPGKHPVPSFITGNLYLVDSLHSSYPLFTIYYLI